MYNNRQLLIIKYSCINYFRFHNNGELRRFTCGKGNFFDESLKSWGCEVLTLG